MSEDNSAPLLSEDNSAPLLQQLTNANATPVEEEFFIAVDPYGDVRHPTQYT